MGFGGGNDLGFGITVGLNDEYSANAKKVGQAHTDMTYTIQRGIEDISKSSKVMDDTLAQNAQRIQQSGMMISTGLSLIGAGTAVLAPVGIGLKYAAEFEMAEAGLTTLLKSTEKAKEVMANVKEDAAKSTMFGFQELLRGNQLLISTGIDASRARRDMNALADAIAATGGGNAELTRMAVNLQQIQSVGKASAVDVKQFAYAGIDIYGLLADSLGVTTAEVKKLDITYDMLTEALVKANGEGGRFAGASERLSQTLAGKWAAFKDQMIFTFAEIGMAVKPFVVPIIDFITFLAKGTALLAATPLGKVIVGLVVVTGVLLIALGGLVTMMGLATGAAARLSTTFIMMGATEIGATFATGGLTAGFTALAVAVWTAMAPLLPFIAIGAAIIAVGYLLNEMLNSNSELMVGFGTAIGIMLGPLGMLFVGFKYVTRGIEDFKKIMSGDMEAQGGLLGFIQKIGGVLISVGEIWNSWNGKTFELSEGLHDALEKVGILEFVLALGTWLVRIKEFAIGFFQPFMYAFSQIGAVFSKLADAFEPLFVPVEKLGQLISKATGETSAWNVVGQIMGTIFMAMTAPLLFFVSVIGFIIELFTDFDSAWEKITTRVDDFMGSIGPIGSFFGAIAEAIAFIFSPLSMLISMFEFMIGLFTDFESGWASISGGVSTVMGWLGLGGDEEGDPKGNAGNVSPNTKTAGSGVMGAGETKNNIKAATASSSNSKTETKTETVKSFNMTVELDGQKLYEKMKDFENLDDSRN